MNLYIITNLFMNQIFKFGPNSKIINYSFKNYYHPQLMRYKCFHVNTKNISTIPLAEQQCTMDEHIKKAEIAVTDFENMEKRQRQAEEFIKKLKKEGHKCISIKESYPIRVGWCGCFTCKDDSN